VSDGDRLVDLGLAVYEAAELTRMMVFSACSEMSNNHRPIMRRSLYAGEHSG
jgi:hypothetical protein